MASNPFLQTVSGTPPRLGRFELVQLLGRGAQAAVWLAHDPLLERDVALKLLHAPADGSLPPEAQQWLKEARNLSRLTHPHIVTLFEADVYDGRPGLVLEYVNGPSLAHRLRTDGALPAPQAVALMLEVLDALATAHAQGVVHRDLKPANILLDPQGHAKVSDFGLALRLSGTQAAALPPGVEGTPGYLSPEAARAQPPAPVSDVFSAGLILAELLTGQPVVAETDPFRAIYRAAHEDLTLPPHPDHPVDDGLRALIHRALARDPSLRFADAAAFADALRQWASQAEVDDSSDGQSATLAFLLRRMKRNSDFPAMSEQIIRVQNLASSETESLNGLTNEILKDVALTNKVLRIVNSAHFSHVGAGNINTVSRAVSLIGFSGIRNVATSLVLLDHMESKAHANQLKGEFLRALLAASLASDLRPAQREAEEVFIGALFQNLGRMLTEFYLPDEAQQVRQAMAPPQQLSEELASRTVLGLSFEGLGQGVGRAWGLPDTLLKLMRKPLAAPPMRQPADVQERMQWVTVAANDMADAFLNAPDDQLATQLRKTAARYAGVLGSSTDQLESAARLARDKLAATAQAIGLRVPANAPGARLLKPPSQPLGASANLVVPGTTELHATVHASVGAGAVTPPAPPAAPPVEAPPAPSASSQRKQADETASLLAQGIQDVTNAMMDEGFKLNDVLRMILEAMYRALGFRQVVFCLKDPRSGLIQGRLGLGTGAMDAAKVFRVDLSDPRNLFALVCNKGLDTLIHNAADPKVMNNLPAWYRQHINAPSFMLLPMQSKGSPYGLIYADQAQADGIVLDDKGLSLLKTLRNQAVMAFRQAQKG
ncbi:MAG TPA: HDOD domain-containing protein [Burkholderiaceae bacterium]|nr:HDOD domain-containing protein [Burkholderiaceae bacterium]